MYVPIPVYAGWGLWWPWYGFGYSFGHGFGYGLGYGFGYGFGYRALYGYGPYAPFGYYGYGPGYEAYEGNPAGVAGAVSEPALAGSIRFEVTPGTARIYIDGALAGTAADLDGTADQLDLAAGGYRLEIRADGYQPYSADILVKAGQTMTERVKLKKQ